MMNKFNALSLSLIVGGATIVATTLTPLTAEAQGFVPCVNGNECNACHLIQMANTIITWLVGFLSLVFAVVMLVAGFKLVTSGGNQQALDAAKSMFANALIGFIIVFAAWLIVDTLMKAVVDEDNLVEGRIWTGIACLEQVRAEASFIALAPAEVCVSDEECADLVVECEETEGAIATEVEDPDTGERTVLCETPAGIAEGGACEQPMTPVNAFGASVTVHEAVAPRLQAASAAWESRGGHEFYRVSSIGGYNCRRVAGSERFSVHAYGGAVDINPTKNPHGATLVTDMPPDFVSMLTSQGFGWGGNWRSSKDAMHYSAASNEGGWMTFE